jgi:hypothetical protein
MVPSFDKAKYTNPKDWDRVLDEHLDLPTNDYWMLHGYHNAVDQRNDTCWTMKTSKYRFFFILYLLASMNVDSNCFPAGPRANDYFGLITLGNGAPSQFVISTATFASLPAEPIDQVFKISVLRNEYDWSPCKIVHHFISSNPINDRLNGNSTATVTDINFRLDCSSSMPISDKNSKIINDQADDNYRLQKIHTVKASFLKDLEEPFNVCGLTINYLSV